MFETMTPEFIEDRGAVNVRTGRSPAACRCSASRNDHVTTTLPSSNQPAQSGRIALDIYNMTISHLCCLA